MKKKEIEALKMDKEKDINSPTSQSLNEAKYRADDAEKIATEESKSAERDKLEEANPSSTLNSREVSQASQQASEAKNDASQAQSDVKQLMTKTKDSALKKNKESNVKGQKSHDVQNNDGRNKAIWEEFGAFIVPIVGFAFIAMLTKGATSSGMVAMLGMIIFALIGVYFGLEAMKELKYVSIVMYVWNALVVVGMLLAVLG